MADNVETPRPGEPRASPEAMRALQAALDAAHAHLRAGRLRQAKDTYLQVLRRYPRNATALHFLGVIAHHEGKLELAAEMMEKSIAQSPQVPVLHGNLGEVYRALGRLDEAIASCRRALATMPVYPEALNTMGMCHYAKGELDEAEAQLAKAVEFKPDFAVAHANLGNVYRARRDHGRSVEAYRRALSARPDFAAVHAALGVTLEAQGRPEEAVKSYRRALELAPKDATVWSNLGVALRALERTDEAIEAFRRAVHLGPELAEAHANLGMALMVQGRLDDAVASYATALRLKRGAPWAERDVEAAPSRPAVRDPSFWRTAENKLRHDIEQFEYLMSEGRLPATFADEVAAYRAVLDEVRESAPASRVVRLSAAQRARIERTYNRAVHIAEAPALEGGALSPALDARAIEDDYRRNAPGVTYVDGVLTPEALEALRRFCLESTIWYDFSHEGGYLGAYLSEGFACGLLFQIVEELRTRLPGIFAEHRLRQMWAYKYDSRLRGIATHADAAAVNVNFWITPDEANLEPDSGGLVVFNREAPLDWDFERYNADQQAIAAFLGESDSVVVPHRQNRAVIFNSNLFHRTDDFSFKEGYENRRINITMLFGIRGSAAPGAPT